MLTIEGFSSDLSVFTVSSSRPSLEHHRRHVSDAVAGEDAADGQNGRQQSGNQQGEGHGQQSEDRQPCRRGACHAITLARASAAHAKGFSSALGP